MANRSRTKLENLHLASLDPQDLIAPNFRLYELTRSELASRSRIDNSLPGDRELRAAVSLARRVLQPIRAAFGSFTPNSVFRSQELERKLKDRPAGWISTSQHTQGCACDVEIAGKTTLELAQWAADHLPEYDQIICECYDPRKGPNSGWVHISLKTPELGANRRKLLSYIRDPDSGQWVYVDGLREGVG
jgi:Peptidase M15